MLKASQKGRSTAGEELSFEIGEAMEGTPIWFWFVIAFAGLVVFAMDRAARNKPKVEEVTFDRW